MEKKTIGQFIAVLRKANGMTQKDLAEKLNVSDKAVSRWERDECAPDLSLIPVIAEIFQVTSDELLRGERKNVEQTAEQPTEEKLSTKSEKQVERILTKSKTFLTIGSIVSIGIAVVGLLVALLCNFAFLRSYLGFFIGCIFFLGAAASLVIFNLLARTSIQGGEIEGMELKFLETKNFFDLTTLKTGFGILAIFLLTIPLAIYGDSHWGITGSEWFLDSLVYETIALILYGIIYCIYKGNENKKNYPMMNEREKTVYDNNKIFRKKVIKRTSVPFVVTLILHCVVGAIPASCFNFAEPTTYTSIAEFRLWIESPINYWEYEDGYAYGLGDSVHHADTVIIGSLSGDTYTSTENIDYFINEEDGTLSEPTSSVPYDTDEYYRQIQIYNEDNTEVIASLSWKNETIYDWSMEWIDGEPIFTVIQRGDMYHAKKLQNAICTTFCVLYGVYALSGIVYYFSKRERI